MEQAHFIDIHAVICFELQFSCYLWRHLRAEVQERLSAPRIGDIPLESTGHHLVEHLEERDEIAFARQNLSYLKMGAFSLHSLEKIFNFRYKYESLEDIIIEKTL